MEGILTIIVIGFLAFVGFCIYFIFKMLEFVIRAINLYKKIVTREDVIIQLLIDIRDNSRSVSATDWSEMPAVNDEESDEDYSQGQEIDEPIGNQDDYKNQEEEEKRRLTKLKMEEERNEEAYNEIKDELFVELKNELEDKFEVSILQNMLRLTYHELKERESKPKDLSDSGSKVLHLILEKIEQHAKRMDQTST